MCLEAILLGPTLRVLPRVLLKGDSRPGVSIVGADFEVLSYYYNQKE